MKEKDGRKTKEKKISHREYTRTFSHWNSILNTPNIRNSD
jgi:hypothetical protein